MKPWSPAVLTCVAVLSVAAHPAFAKTEKAKTQDQKTSTPDVKWEAAVVKCGVFTGNDKALGWERPATYAFAGDTILMKRSILMDEYESWKGLKAPSGQILLIGSGGKANQSSSWVMEFTGNFQKDNTILKGRYTSVAGTSGYRECEVQFR